MDIDFLNHYNPSLESCEFHFDSAKKSILLNIVNKYSINEKDSKKLLSMIYSALNGDIDDLTRVLIRYPEAFKLIEDVDLVISNKIPFYKSLYDTIGKDKFLNIITSYGEELIVILNTTALKYGGEGLIQTFKDKDIDFIQYQINRIMHSSIYKQHINIKTLPLSFKKEYPDLYISDDAPELLQLAYYRLQISGEYLHNHRDWTPYLKGVNICMMFERKTITTYDANSFEQKINIYDLLIKYFTNEEILELITNYGTLFDSMNLIITDITDVTKEKILDSIDNTIYNMIVNRQSFYDDKLPQNFINSHPELFVSDNDFKQLFYHKKITPRTIKEHPQYIEFLLNKRIDVCFENKYVNFIRTCTNLGISNEEIMELCKKYGDYVVIFPPKSKDLSNYDEEFIEELIHKIKDEFYPYDDSIKDLVYQYIPEYFLDVDIKELSDAFYNKNGNKEFGFEFLKRHREYLPYVVYKKLFNAFNNTLDSKLKNIYHDFLSTYGNKLVLEVGTKNPKSVTRMLAKNKGDVLIRWYRETRFVPSVVLMTNFPEDRISSFMKNEKKWSNLTKLQGYSAKDEYLEALLKISMCFGIFDDDPEGYNKVINLITHLPKIVDKDELVGKKDVINVILSVYEINNDGDYQLRNAPISYNVRQTIKFLLEQANVSNVFTCDVAHQLIGDFKMEYNPKFRELFLDNIDEILTNDEYRKYISTIFNSFNEISSLNSNRVLTLPLAIGYLKTNKFSGVNQGNYRLSDNVSSAGYTQREYDLLQIIYNYGKLRIYSTIPRVEGKSDKYTYEMLRLDDSLPLIIGKLTDCCQKLDDSAETCMIHSMVDKNGRLFIVKDDEDHVVAQSWVWRNGNVLCFDNIEVPKRALARNKKEGFTSDKFSDEILSIYIKASEEIFSIDDRKYTELYEKGLIASHDFSNLKLGKITIGRGYNDIADSVERNLAFDVETVRPALYSSPIDNTPYLYLDSDEQYIVYQRSGYRFCSDEPLSVYNDDYKINDINSITTKNMIELKKLEAITKGYVDGHVVINLSDSNCRDIFEKTAYIYDFDPFTMRIISNSNFAIIYEEDDDSVKIGELLFINQVNGKDVMDDVSTQIKFALNQISHNKEFDITQLNPKQKEAFKASNDKVIHNIKKLIK